MSRYNLPVIASDTSLSQYLAEIRKFPMLEAEEEYMLAKRWTEHTDYSAAQRLVTSHLRLVVKIAKGFRGYGLPIGDLVAEGNIGLMQAVKKFDPEKGFRLSTYAIWWIRAAIQEYILRSWSLVKVGSSAAQKRLFFNLRKEKARLNALNQRELTPEQAAEIAAELEVGESDVMDMDRRMNAVDQQLNARIGPEGEQEWIDLLEEPSDNQEILLEHKQEKDQRLALLEGAMESLSEREREIVSARRLSETPSTLEELSQIYLISRERVRQIEARAMEKLTAAVLAKQAA